MPPTKQKVAEQMHQYTGLPMAYILKADLKVTGGEFAHELLGDSDDVTGRLDSRYSGPAMDPMGAACLLRSSGFGDRCADRVRCSTTMCVTRSISARV